MKNPIYNANFITAGRDFGTKCPEFYKEFSADADVKKATLHISALGIYDARINGIRVCDSYMLPGWTEYTKRLQYQSYDVTELIGEDNKITVGLGHGWWGLKIGYEREIECDKDFPSLIAALEIEYESGKTDYISTDESWSYSETDTLFSHIYHGEVIDARITSSHKDTDKKAKIFDYDKGVLIPHEGEFTREIERVSVKNILHSPSGETILDFGQEVTGTVEFVLNASGGETVKILHGEVLDKDGNFYNDNYREARAEIVYTAKPGWQTYKAKYTFFGFRYIKLVDWCEQVRAENFAAIVLHSDIKRTGYFKCGHTKLNKLYSNIIWGQRDNFLDIPTDCPQRDERLGWTGDTQMFSRTACINYDCQKFYEKWLNDMISAQRDDGRIPHVIPTVAHWSEKEDSSAAWADASCIVPIEVYTAYGNEKMLKKCYPMMKKWVGYILSKEGKKYLWQNNKHFGDWLGLDAPAGSYKGSTSEELIATAFFYYSTTLVAKASRILGYGAEKYDKMAERIRSAYQKEYIKRGKLISDTQTAHVLTIHFGLVDDKPQLKARLGERLVELIEEFGDRLKTGFVGTPYLLDALTDIGRADKAYTLLLQEQYPSWLFSVNMGATTIWEHWDGMREDGSFWSRDMNSFNHYAYGACASWFYRTICGIKPKEPEYKSFDISPIPSPELGYAKARIETRSGVIVSEWVYENDGIRYTFTVPSGTSATITVDGVTKEYAPGTYTMWGKA